MMEDNQTKRIILRYKGHTSGHRAIGLLMVLIMGILPLYSYDNLGSPYAPTPSERRVRTSTDVMLVALPATALAVTLFEKDWEGLKEEAISAGVTLGVTLALKACIKETRPDHSNNHSFPSGHSSITFAAATYIGKRYGWKWSIPAYALSTYTAWGRVYGKKHHWHDVVVGAAIGAASSYIFTHPYLQKHEAAIVPTAGEGWTGAMASFCF